MVVTGSGDRRFRSSSTAVQRTCWPIAEPGEAREVRGQYRTHRLEGFESERWMQSTALIPHKESERIVLHHLGSRSPQHKMIPGSVSNEDERYTPGKRVNGQFVYCSICTTGTETKDQGQDDIYNITQHRSEKAANRVRNNARTSTGK